MRTEPRLPRASRRASPPGRSRTAREVLAKLREFEDAAGVDRDAAADSVLRALRPHLQRHLRTQDPATPLRSYEAEATALTRTYGAEITALAKRDAEVRGRNDSLITSYFDPP